MPFEYVEDGVTSDLSFRAWAATLSDLFVAAADATIGAMIEDPAALLPVEHRAIAVEADAPDLLLLRFLGEVVFRKDAEGLLARPSEVAIVEEAGRWHAAATLRGERVDPDRHALACDVKAVTLAGLAVTRTADGWQATVTLDV